MNTQGDVDEFRSTGRRATAHGRFETTGGDEGVEIDCGRIVAAIGQHDRFESIEREDLGQGGDQARGSVRFRGDEIHLRITEHEPTHVPLPVATAIPTHETSARQPCAQDHVDSLGPYCAIDQRLTS